MKKKPKPKKSQYYDYRDCVGYISEKLGYDIDNTTNCPYDHETDCEFRCYWHFVMDKTEIHNGCLIYLLNRSTDKPWQQEITKAFHEEFGEDTQYWVEW